MKYEWEADDIRAGRVVHHHGVKFIICWRHTPNDNEYGTCDTRDGLCMFFVSKELAAAHLTKSKALPESFE